MFNFGAYRGFLMLTAFDLCLGACGVLLTLAGTEIDFVVDRLTGLVLLQRSWSFLRSEIAAVPIDLFLISGKKFRGHRNIMLVGSCHGCRLPLQSIQNHGDLLQQFLSFSLQIWYASQSSFRPQSRQRVSRIHEFLGDLYSLQSCMTRFSAFVHREQSYIIIH